MMIDPGGHQFDAHFGPLTVGFARGPGNLTSPRCNPGDGGPEQKGLHSELYPTSLGERLWVPRNLRHHLRLQWKTLFQ